MGLSSKRKGRWRYRFWQKMFLTLIGLPLLVGLVLGFVAIFRAVFVTQLDGSMLHIIDDQETQDIVDESQSMERAERLAGALKIATISYDTDHQENENLLAFIKYLEKGLTRGKLPYLLASHLDVVPVDAKAWEFPPFSGRIVNRTYVYGRGAIDDKAGVMGIMEAVEYMLQKKQRPQRTFFMAFGHDEEVRFYFHIMHYQYLLLVGLLLTYRL
nr:unnamed protein product [Timema californicum]